MNNRLTRRACLAMASIMLTVLLSGCLLAAPELTGPSSSSSVVTTAPGQTTTQIPPDTTPGATTSIPETTLPTTAPPLPTVTQPPETQPPETQPPETQPPETQPPEMQPPETQPDDPAPVFPVLDARNAFVYDTYSGQYLYRSCDLYTAINPASTTKLFTTYVALQYLELDAFVTVGDELSMVVWDASVAGLKQGDTLTVKALAECALLVSGCDASYTLAAAAGRAMLRDSNASTAIAVQTFMTEVNQRAALLGMVNTHFVTPDGYHHAQHYISLQAFATIAERCMEDAAISRMVGTYRTTISVTNAAGSTRNMTLRNSNALLNPSNTEFYCQDALGLKTGYTSAAGYCLLSAFRTENGYLIIGVFGCTVPDGRFQDTLALLDYFTD